MAIFNSKLLVYQRVSLGCWGQSLHLHQPVTTCLDVFHVYASQYVVFRHIQAIYNPYNNYTTWILWPGIFQSYHCSLTSIRPGWNPTCSHRKNRAIFPPCEKLPKGKKVPLPQQYPRCIRGMPNLRDLQDPIEDGGTDSIYVWPIYRRPKFQGRSPQFIWPKHMVRLRTSIF